MNDKIDMISNLRNRPTTIWNCWLLIAVLGMGGIFLGGCKQDRLILSGEPSITISPQFGGANTEVVVSGFGFSPGTAVMVRLGPPDVGATPKAYASAVSGDDGRFVLSFIIPEQWPDGQPIVEPELLVIVLNTDGNLKASAPFQFQSDRTINPEMAEIEIVETVDPLLISNEQAIVAAVIDHLTQTGASSEVAVSVQTIEGEFARVGIFDLAPDSPGKSLGFLKLVDSVWEVLIVGQDFDSEQLLELGIPQSILPEALLIPEG